MANLLVDERDQQFLLNEVLEVEKLCEKPVYADFSKDMFDMVMTEAQKLGEQLRTEPEARLTSLSGDLGELQFFAMPEDERQPH